MSHAADLFMSPPAPRRCWSSLPAGGTAIQQLDAESKLLDWGSRLGSRALPQRRSGGGILIAPQNRACDFRSDSGSEAEPEGHRAGEFVTFRKRHDDGLALADDVCLT